MLPGLKAPSVASEQKKTMAAEAEARTRKTKRTTDEAPPLYGLHEGSLEPCDIGHLSHHGASALRLAAAHHLRLDIEGLQS